MGARNAGFRLELPAARARTAQQQRVENGSAAEDLLAEHHKVCRLLRVADVRWRAAAMQIVGRTERPGVFRAVFPRGVGQGVDYSGHLLDGSARAVYVECKNVQDAAEPFDLEEVTPGQRELLDAAHAAGCVAVVAVVHGPRRVLYALPWARVRAGARRLSPEDLRPYLAPVGRAYLQEYCVAAR